MLSLGGIYAGSAPQNVTFTFRAADGSPDVTQTVLVPASGAFSLSGLMPKKYVAHIKPEKYLSVNVPLDLTNGNVLNLTATFLPGDSNNDDSSDSSDFTALIGAFNSDINIPGSGYNPAADFDGDGMVDSNDFTLLIGSFGQTGAP